MAGSSDFVLRVADRIAGLPVHLADGDDVAAAGVFHFGGLLAADAVQTAELIGGGSAHVAQGHIGGDAALHDLYEAVLAELVGNGLEDKALGRSRGVDAVHLHGSRDIVHDTLQEGLGADVLHGGAGEHGNHAAVLHTGADSGDHVGLFQFHRLKELLHELFGGACGGLHEFHSQVLDMAGIGGGDRALGALGAVGHVADVVDQIDHALAVGGRDGNRGDDAAVLGTQRIHHREVIAVLFIALGDHERRREIGRLEVLPAALGADGNSVLGRAEDHTRFHRAKGTEDFADEVKISRAVQNIHFSASEGNRSQRGCDGDLALDFFRVIIAYRVPVAHLSKAVDSAGDKQHTLGKAGLSAVSVPEKGDVANVFTFHNMLPL